MQRISVKDQAEAVARAKAGVDNLAAHPNTTRSRLGAARDQHNIASTWSDPAVVWDAVAAIEGSVLEVYGPASHPLQPDLNRWCRQTDCADQVPSVGTPDQDEPIA